MRCRLDGDEVACHAQRSITELLDERVLVGTPLISDHGEARTHGLALAVGLFAQRLHHQLLRVLSEGAEGVNIRKQRSGVHIVGSPQCRELCRRV